MESYLEQWESALQDIEKNNDRTKFIELVKIGNGDFIFAKECSNAEAIVQIKMELENNKPKEWFSSRIESTIEDFKCRNREL